MNKIEDYFKNDEYHVFFGHDMPIPGYEYIEDYDEEISRELFVALFKLFIRYKRSDDICNTYAKVMYCFDDEFGYYNGDENYGSFIESLKTEDYQLSNSEENLLKDFLNNLIDGVTEFEESEYDPDFADPFIEYAIENEEFVIVFSSHSFL